ncbi:MAG: diadenylate cyclase CdaA [Kiritimatiellae bacterium]|nr:diadenylate cyclase CdaA [Kiritimatiellia bacterium]
MWSNLQLGDLVQIAILAVSVFFLCSLFRGTRSAQMLLGLVLVLLGLIVMTMLFNFEVLGWLLRSLSVYFFFGLLIIFQPEIRQALAIIGRRRLLFGQTRNVPTTMVDHVVGVVESLARQRIGALIAVEREISLDGYRQSGTLLNAPLVPKLLASLFYPRTPLHDGGAILRDGVIVAARCIFPLATSDAAQGLGTRHRAALGLSEETDAVVIVVSEERGTIAMAFQGRLLRNLTPTRLTRYLTALLPKEGLVETWRRVWDGAATRDDTVVDDNIDEATETLRP